MSRIRSLLLPIASAAVTAAIIVAVMSPAPARPTAPAPEAQPRRPRLVFPPAANGPPPLATVDDTTERVAALEDRVAALAPPTDAPPDLDPDTARAEALARWQDTLAAHDAEPIDKAWAAEVTPRYARDLYALSQSDDASFDVLDTSCKTTTCSALLEFPDYGAATDEFTQLLYYDYEQNCSKEILLPEPADPDARYRATVLFDCG